MSGSNIVNVDGRAYAWRVEEDEEGYSLSFSKRGLTYPPTLFIEGDDGVAVSFAWERPGVTQPGWWRIASSLDRIVERAVRIARSRGWTMGDRVEAIEGPPTTVFDELAAARAALGQWPREFAVAMLAVGCAHAHDDDREAIDDWVASNADVLAAAGPWLHAVLEIDGTNEVVYRYRSAVEFLVEMTSRLNVSTGVSTSSADAALRTRTPVANRPWGIPVAHWWWRQGRTYDRDPHDPDDV